MQKRSCLHPIPVVGMVLLSSSIHKSLLMLTGLLLAFCLYSALNNIQLSRLNRTQFEIDAKYRKAQEAEAAQEADSILNHILKNLMTEAVGLIEIFVSKFSDEPVSPSWATGPALPGSISSPTDRRPKGFRPRSTGSRNKRDALQRNSSMKDPGPSGDVLLPGSPTDVVDVSELTTATRCLQKGLQWCQGRQMLLALAAGQYVPTREHVSLPEFAAAVVQGRSVAVDVDPVRVSIDPLLCKLVVENALSNAVKHGHPGDPEVCLSMKLAEAATGRACRLSCTVTNRANPERPQVRTFFLISARE